VALAAPEGASAGWDAEGRGRALRDIELRLHPAMPMMSDIEWQVQVGF
jgi:hypothetical protein